jgi:nitroreductase
MNVDEALKARISVRVFKPDPLPEKLVREILDVARFAPSGGNTQPWRMFVVSGAERDKVSAVVKEAVAKNPRGEEGNHKIYPDNLWEPYRTRRFKVGEDMYEKLGIGREDKASRFAHIARNYDFFGAPVGVFFAIDRGMGHGQWAHLGMLMQSVALAAIERGVSSCMQEAWARARETLAKHFGLPDNEMIYCGMALGYADDSAAVNALRSDRAPLEEIATFKGF